MATSGNIQVILPPEVLDDPSGGSSVLQGLADAVISTGGSNTLVGANRGAESSGGNTVFGEAEALGPLPAGSAILMQRNETVGPITGGSQTSFDEANAMAGNIQGRSNSGLAATSPGGLGVSVGGTAFSERQEVNLVPSLGVTPTAADDAGNDRADVSFEINAEVEIDRRTVDLVAAGSEVLYSPVAPLVGIEVTRITIRTLIVTTPGIAPQISIQTLSAGDIRSVTVVTPTDANRVQSILANAESAFTTVGNSITLVKDVLSTAAVYSVEVSLYGRARK